MSRRHEMTFDISAAIRASILARKILAGRTALAAIASVKEKTQVRTESSIGYVAAQRSATVRPRAGFGESNGSVPGVTRTLVVTVSGYLPPVS